MEDQLAAFLRHKNEHASSPEIDWQAKKEKWVLSVENLYQSVEKMLQIASGDVKTRRLKIRVTEDFIGTYSIPSLELSIANERVKFRPKGVTVIGAAGRVDIRGEGDTVTLLKDTGDLHSGWTVILQRVPHLKTVQLDRESLKYALERVMLPLT
jgi:hypothetical protein